jgi:hypothetical protein
MAKERPFGTIPDWAMKGPIDLRNYNYRAEKHCAGFSAKRAGEHPTITRDSKNFMVWREYFERYLGGRPWAFKALLDGRIQSMTLPEELPQWFDPTFTATPGWRPAGERPPVKPPTPAAPADPVGNYAKYGDYGSDNDNDDYENLDGKHAERVAADIAERRQRASGSPPEADTGANNRRGPQG